MLGHPHDGPEVEVDSAPSTSDAYQVDVVVALFAILLILLLTGVARIKSEPARDSRIEYRPSDVPTAPFQLRSLAPTYPYQAIWVAKEGELIRLDLRAVAERYLAGSAAEHWEWLPPVDLSVAPAGDEPGSYRLNVAFSGDGFPPELAATRVALTDPDAAAAAVTAAAAGALIYAWDEDLAGLQPLLARLRAEGFCHRLIPVERERVLIERNSAHLLAHKVLRCF
jgi:hypothetical protein